MVWLCLQALRKKGLAQADKKAGRIAAEGLLAQYVHAGSRSPLPPATFMLSFLLSTPFLFFFFICCRKKVSLFYKESNIFVTSLYPLVMQLNVLVTAAVASCCATAFPAVSS